MGCDIHDLPSRQLSHVVAARFLRMENYIKSQRCAIPQPHRALVISTDRIGDTFNCIYFLANLRRSFPRAHVTFVGKLFGCTSFLKVLLGQYCDSALFVEGLSQRQLAALRPDIAFDLNPISGLFPFSVPCLRVGHHEGCDLLVPGRGFNCKSNDHLNILRAIGERVQFAYAPIVLPPQVRKSSHERASVPYTALCLEATASSWMMTARTTNELIEHLLQTTNHELIILGSNINGNGISFHRQHPRVRNMTASLSLFETIQIIGNANQVIAVDTGLMHAASYLGAPLLAIFTCGDPGRSGPQGQWGPVALVRVAVDPPTGIWQKSDRLQSGIERRFLRSEHIIHGLASLRGAKPTTIAERVIRTRTLELPPSKQEVSPLHRPNGSAF